MARLFAGIALLGLAGCASDHYSGNQLCAGTGGCISSFTDRRQGPIHAQAVAPDAPSGLQPQR